MSILDMILQHYKQNVAPQPPMPSPLTGGYPAPIPPQEVVTPVVNAITDGGGMLNQIKDARRARQAIVDSLLTADQ